MLYLAIRVEVDEVAQQSGSMNAPDFSTTYKEVLSRLEIKGCCISVYTHKDLNDLKFIKKIYWCPVRAKQTAQDTVTTLIKR